MVKKKELKIDLGCGSKKLEGFIGVDKIKFKGVDKVFDFGKVRWPFKACTVDEIYSSHALEHLTPIERVHFANELDRVLKKTGKATIVVPHWGTCRAYGDPTHQWPPVSEFWFYYLDSDWRAEHAPHTDKKHWKDGFSCNLECTWGYGMNPSICNRSQDFQQFALNHYREAIFDIHATITKK